MGSGRSIKFKWQHIVALLAVIAAGIIGWQLAGWLVGVVAAIVVLGTNEVIERRTRAK